MRLELESVDIHWLRHVWALLRAMSNPITHIWILDNTSIKELNIEKQVWLNHYWTAGMKLKYEGCFRDELRLSFYLFLIFWKLIWFHQYSPNRGVNCLWFPKKIYPLWMFLKNETKEKENITIYNANIIGNKEIRKNKVKTLNSNTPYYFLS